MYLLCQDLQAFFFFGFFFHLLCCYVKTFGLFTDCGQLLLPLPAAFSRFEHFQFHPVFCHILFAFLKCCGYITSAVTCILWALVSSGFLTTFKTRDKKKKTKDKEQDGQTQSQWNKTIKNSWFCRVRLIRHLPRLQHCPLPYKGQRLVFPRNPSQCFS